MKLPPFVWRGAAVAALLLPARVGGAQAPDAAVYSL
jgi:hypothetical protein